MKQIELAYGSGTVQFSFDDDRFTILAPSPAEEQPLSDMEIGQALDSPIDSRPLEEVLASGQSVLIVVSDATRATASAQVVNLLVRRIIQQGVSAADVAIIFATGIHRRVTAEEKQMLLTPFITQRIRVLDHDAVRCRESHPFGRDSKGHASRSQSSITRLYSRYPYWRDWFPLLCRIYWRAEVDLSWARFCADNFGNSHVGPRFREGWTAR